MSYMLLGALCGPCRYRYECSKIGGLGTCFDYYSAQVRPGGRRLEIRTCCRNLEASRASQKGSHPPTLLQFQTATSSLLALVAFVHTFKILTAGGRAFLWAREDPLEQTHAHVDGDLWPQLSAGRFSLRVLGRGSLGPRALSMLQSRRGAGDLRSARAAVAAGESV